MRIALDLGQSDTLVLAYHAVSASWPASLAIEPDRLDSQLQAILRRGYRPSTFTEAVGNRRRPGKRVVVTFDDGLRSVLDRALPILEARDVPGTVFVPTGYIGRPEPVDWPVLDQWLGTPHEHELLPMSWPELALLADRGWEVGSHSHLHPRLPALDDERLRAELTRSRTECEERLGRACRSIAYPYGNVDRRVVSAAKRAGYLAGASLPSRIHRHDPLRWPRIGIWRTDAVEAFTLKTSPVARRWLDLSTGRLRLLPRWRLTA